MKSWLRIERSHMYGEATIWTRGVIRCVPPAERATNGQLLVDRHCADPTPPASRPCRGELTVAV